MRLHAARGSRTCACRHLNDEHGVASFVVLARRREEGKCQAIFDLARYFMLTDLRHAGLQHLLMVLASILV